MNKPKQEDFSTLGSYIIALENYIESLILPEKIIKITNSVKDVIYLDLDKIEYIREINESAYKVYLITGRIFDLKDEDFGLLELIKLWKESKK